MSDTAQIRQAAEALGKLIAAHPAALAAGKARAALEADVETARLLTDFQRHMDTLAEKQAAGRPIEVADKRKAEELQQKVAASDLVRQLQKAEMDYLDLLRAAHDTMMRHAGADDIGDTSALDE